MSSSDPASSTLDSQISARLRKLRAERNWSLDELARRSGVSRATLSRLENAEVSPTASVLGRLCAAYGLTMSRLMRMVEDEEYCIDMCNQINAIRRALEGVALIIMKRHVESCVAHAIHEDGGKEKVDEVLATIDRFIR